MPKKYVVGIVLALASWTIGFYSLSERPLIRPKTSCVELQKEAVRISVNQATELVPAIVRISQTRPVDSKNFSRYHPSGPSECRAIATLSDGSTTPVEFWYGQDTAGERIYAVERYGSDGKIVAVQSVPRGEVEYGFVSPTLREHMVLLLGVGIVLAVYAYAHRLAVFWWS